MLPDRYIYPAVFDYADDGISVEFPDLPGCLTCGNSDEEAIRMAKDALSLHLYGMEQDGDPVPAPTKASQLHVEGNQVVVFVETWMPPFRGKMEGRAIKKTLTIPKWLNDLAEENQINFSHILQDALMDHLGVNRKQPR
jgi:predicted RNase H-like HicB family nuclease